MAAPVEQSPSNNTSQAGVTEEPSFGAQLGRQLGLTARAGIEGVTGLPQLLTNAGIGAYNLGAQGVNKLAGTHLPQLPSATQSLEHALNRIGLPQPQGTGENIANIGAQLLAGGFSAPAEQAAIQRFLPNAPAATTAPSVEQARAAGYKLTPTQLSKTGVSRKLEDLAGADQIARAASVKNQDVTNMLAGRAIGLPEGKPITTAAIDERIQQLGGAYKTVRELKQPFALDTQFKQDIAGIKGAWGKAAAEFPALLKNKDVDLLVKELSQTGGSTRTIISPDAAVSLVQKLRTDAGANLKNFTDPHKRALGLAQRKAAEALDSLVERGLARRGNPQIYQDYVAARKGIAQAYTVRNALNDASGNVSAPYLGQQLAKDKPLTGELRQIAQTANAFPQAMREVEAFNPRSSISPHEVWLLVTQLAHGALAGIPATLAGRPLARAAALSEPGQKLLSMGVSHKTLAKLAGTAARLSNMGAQGEDSSN